MSIVNAFLTLKIKTVHFRLSDRPYSIVYSCIFIRFTSVHLWLLCANSPVHFDTDGTNDTHDTQTQMSELVIKFLRYIFEYGTLSPRTVSYTSKTGQSSNTQYGVRSTHLALV